MRRAILSTAVGAVVAFWVAGCATDRLDAAPPSGVNLTGDWRLNLNLSDDPDKLGPDIDTTAPKRAPGSHRGHGGGRGGGGMPPMGTPPDGGPTASIGSGRSPAGADSSIGVGGISGGSIGAGGIGSAGYSFMRVALAQSPDGPGPSDAQPPSPGQPPPPGASGGKPSRGTSIARYLRAPSTLSITQDNGSLTVKTNMPDGTQTSDTYTAGTKTTIPFGRDETAERTAGWRGPVFVVTTSAKKFGSREDEFAIDAEDGRLIMTTLTKGGRLGKVEITRVYDRAKPN
jgi:hypothetical protein